MRQSLTTYCM